MRAWLSIGLVVACTLAFSPAALADTSASSNWSGYAAHRAGVSFQTVVGSWRQPSASCTPGKDTYSAMWVGLGGFNPRAKALEQIGTEVDCTLSGQAVSYAWYELVPAASTNIRMRVRPGDLMRATVTVVRRRVTVKLVNVTSGRTFRKTLRARRVDISSAEWIVEAPSDCSRSCTTLPLADFASATFQHARARSTRGHWGSISDRHWRATKIQLLPGGTHYVVYHGKGGWAGAATPSALRHNGTTFDVTYVTVAVPSRRVLAARAFTRSSHDVSGASRRAVSGGSRHVLR